MTSPVRRTAGAAVAALTPAVLTATLFLLPGCHRTPPLTDQQLAGKHLYETRCAHCHEDNDLQLKKVPPNLHHIFVKGRLPSGAPATDLQIERTILSGKGMMPSFAGRFTQEQMAALLAYLHTGLR
ncbi:MAG TPA: cytochrome c [Terracidiphilus sp.]|nr:cytochrome c [Terracidiphilus sp.]